MTSPTRPVHSPAERSPGHLYVVPGDIRALAVSAWLLPTDVSGTFSKMWLTQTPAAPGLPARIATWKEAPDRWGRAGARTRLLPGGAPREPVIVLGAVPDAGTDSPDYHADTVRSAIRTLDSDAPSWRRAGAVPPRLALPALGTGRSRSASEAGVVLGGLLPLLRGVAEQEGVDLVVVARDGVVLSAARAVRRRHGHGWWPDLSEQQWSEVSRLADHAARGSLALFTGAGTSMAAGLPSWSGLLDDVEGRVTAELLARGVKPLPSLAKLSLLDRATVLEDALRDCGSELTVEALVLDVLRHSRYSVQHGLLAGLPLSQAITLNYDRLLERAAVDIERPFARLPYEPAGGRWLLKLHGDLDEDEGAGSARDMVLTREHYLTATTHRAALTGLVQAVLTTQHLLFVGFGLQDDHIHALVHDVRTALGPSRNGVFGTALMVDDDPAVEVLWRRDLSVLPLVDRGAQGVGGVVTSRRLEIFLDALGNEADGSHRHVLDPAWAGVLEEGDEELTTLLREAARRAAGRGGAAWAPLRRALEAYGWSDRGASR